MSFKKWGIPLITVVGLLLVVAWMAGVFSSRVAPGLLERSSNSTVESYSVMLSSKPNIESIPAGIKAREATLVSSQILSRIKNIHVRAGESVVQDQLLVTLESAALKAQLAQVVAMEEAAQASLIESQETLERTQALKDKGLVSQSVLDNAIAGFRRYDSEVVAAKQRKQAAQTALEYTEIVSPFSGVVVERSAEPGNMASPGQLLLSLYDPLTLQIEADVRESLAIKLQVGRKISVEIDSLGKNIDATIVEIVPAADPNARSFLVKAGIEFDPQLKPGMFARMLIEDGTSEVLSIPVNYVKSYGQLDMVWLLQDGEINRRFVRLGKTQGDQVEIISGLNSGETLVLSAI
ncbi:efflux RND transporter periplasmic adaptor subunit [Paraglaciecola arctica]|uniref:efflux RND transporter periplasmic adaptor subunit n=1 Tax=Paraglaciecola arctica TaxID=1128911 RepID=UPI001C06B88C|nr:efflux RND transporter periplasmic adaptor subunit [Paraglaciecola arctica]MBU3002779.1 efflux RND transporter periplasmic adaptor subunit [Paraglaciecola arctica]